VWWGTTALSVPFIGRRVGIKGGQEGMHLMTMVDLQCADFVVEGEMGAETAEGRGRDSV
jgi:hypothetical protein